MSNNPNPNQDPNNDFYNDQLLEDDPFDIRLSIGKSTSCPPQNLEGPLLSSSPDPTQKGTSNHSIASKEYYYYYHSLKPRDPRLPQPKWRPAFQEGLQSFGANQSIPEEGHNGQISRMSSNSGVYDNSTDISNEFNQAMTFGDNSDDNNGNERSYNQRGHQGYNRNYQNNRGNGVSGQYHNRNQNYQRPQNGNPNYHDRRNNGHDSQGHQGHNQHGQNRPNTHHKQQYGQNNAGQGGYNNQQQQQNPQMQGMFMPNYGGNPQMQPQQFYPGMNPYQQMNMYQVDPNMAYSMGNYGGFPQDPRMNQMGNYNQYYMQQNAGYMNPYQNQMGVQPNMQGMQGVQGNMQQPNFMNQQQQQQHHSQQHQQQNKGGPKTFNKNFNPNHKGNYQGNHMNQKIDINSVMSNLLENCRDQNGSRLIQQHFEKADYEEQEKIFEQIYPQAYSLMTDVFGNYVIQKIFEFGNEQQKTALYNEMQGKIFELCQNAYGCRVVQKALESDSTIQDEILKEISNHVLELVEDPNGNHVIQKCFEDIPIRKLQFIIDEVSKQVENLAFNAFGCRVIQKILQNSTPEINRPILKTLLKNNPRACGCQYANYIMQYLLEKGPQPEKEELCDFLKSNFVKLSMNKFASNVTEKSAIYGSEQFKRDVANILISTKHENKLGLVVLMGDRFGNYVIQRLFECGNEELRHKIYETIVQPENLEEIKKTNFGKHVLDFIEKLMEGKRGQ